MRILRASVLAALLMHGACSPAARQEGAQIAEAMDRFRKADNAQKPSMVASLRAVPCSSADVCTARDACLASAEGTAKALTLKSEVEQGLAALDKGVLPADSDTARVLPGKLDEAETLLKDGFAKLPACDDQILALKRKYRF